MSELVTVAYIYDRNSSPNLAVLEARLNRCQEFISARPGWRFGGWFIDKGEDALSEDQRPSLDIMCTTMRNAAPATRICVVHDWERFAWDAKWRSRLARRVLTAGASVWTVGGEKLSPGGQLTPLGRVSAAPIFGGRP